MEEVKIGKYKHFKGKFVEVLMIAKHSETLEDYVVYKELEGYGPGNDLWIRPKKMFLEEVEVMREGKKIKVPRFEFVGN